MRILIWAIGGAGTAYLAWLLLRKSGDSAAQAGTRMVRAATSGSPVTGMAEELKNAWAEHHTVA